MNETARIEACSDGVISIAVTHLVLELKPPPSVLPLLQGILQLWPRYLSFVLSFFFNRTFLLSRLPADGLVERSNQPRHECRTGHLHPLSPAISRTRTAIRHIDFLSSSYCASRGAVTG